MCALEVWHIDHLTNARSVRKRGCRPTGHPTFEKGELHLREAPRHAAEEQRLAHGIAGLTEMADMVEDEIRNRVAQSSAAEWNVTA